MHTAYKLLEHIRTAQDNSLIESYCIKHTGAATVEIHIQLLSTITAAQMQQLEHCIQNSYSISWTALDQDSRRLTVAYKNTARARLLEQRKL